MAFDPVLELAENASTYTPLGPAAERVVTDRYVLWTGGGGGPAWNVAQRFRVPPDELSEVRREIHEQTGKRGRSACSWEVGSSAQPAGLVEGLLALGLVDDGDSAEAGTALVGPPARGVDRVLVHARLQDAAARGTAVAVTQLGRKSRPIPARAGLGKVCRIGNLIDDVGRG